MGALGDGIGDTGDAVATTRQMRTAPLWGNRFRKSFLHDGRCADVRCAIRAHDGQGANEKRAFDNLGSVTQNLLITFVRSL